MRERIQAKIGPELLERLDRFAEQNKWTRSWAITVLITEALERRNDPEPLTSRLVREPRPPFIPDPGPVVEHPSHPDPKPHYHRYVDFIKEVKADKGRRYGLYACECGEATSKQLDSWDAAIVDATTPKENS